MLSNYAIRLFILNDIYISFSAWAILKVLVSNDQSRIQSTWLHKLITIKSVQLLIMRLLNNRVLSFLMLKRNIRYNLYSITTSCENSSFVKEIRTMSTASILIEDLPRGPLDAYRKRATFDWKSFKLALEGKDSVRYQVMKSMRYV